MGKHVKTKYLITNWICAIGCLGAFAGLIGMTIQFAHWHGLTADELYKDIFGDYESKLGLAGCALGLVTLVTGTFAFMFNKTKVFLILCGIMLITTSCFDLCVILRTKRPEEDLIKEFKERYEQFDLPIPFSTFEDEYTCTGLESIANSCPTIKYNINYTCCDEAITRYIEKRSSANQAYLVFYLGATSSGIFFLLITMFLYYREKQKAQ